MTSAVKYPGIRVTTNGNQMLGYYTEPLVADVGVFYPITPSTEQGENFQLSYAKGRLNAFGEAFLAIEAEGEHAAQGGAIAASITGKRVANFTSGQGLLYALEQFYHAPGKLSTMVIQIGARAITKHALNVHCGHDDVYAALDSGWLMTFAKDAQQAADQSLILRKVCELSLNPGLNAQDGFLTTHLERTFVAPEPGLVREYLGHPADIIPCPTPAQKELFGPTRRRIPEVIDLKHPQVVGPVQNQEHYMNGVAARRNNFTEPILPMFEQAFAEFARLTGRRYGLISAYRTDDAETVYVALGSAAENIEAGVDHLRAQGEKAGVVHVNVLRPFPEAAIITALKGKKRVIVLERSENALSADNLLMKDIRAALHKAADNAAKTVHPDLPALTPAEMPDLFAGVYGLGSRDFRPEGILGAYEFATGRIARKDGKKAGDGVRFFYVGIDHPYAVISKERPSFLPDKAISVRLHSIGGWGMITTGKNLGEILGTLSNAVAERDNLRESDGSLKEIVHISANPKYGSEKKGAPTSYFLVAAPDRVRVNCDLQHVDVVLCCDPKAFLHCDPLFGLREGGAFVWESGGMDADQLWQLIPVKARKAIVEKKIRVYGLDGFKIARGATPRPDLQLRMQGNAFLGAFFAVSPFLDTYRIGKDEYAKTVRKQYVKKFGKQGDAVVDSNMAVMQQGYDTLVQVQPGRLDAPDRSSFSDVPLSPALAGCGTDEASCGSPIYSKKYFNSEYKAGYGYDQPASPLASVGVMAAGTGAEASKYVARRAVPVWKADKCTQCMECVTVCPDTALPNTAQELTTVLRTAVRNYVGDAKARAALESQLVPIASAVRAGMKAALGGEEKPLAVIAEAEFKAAAGRDQAITPAAIEQAVAVLKKTPFGYKRAKGIFELPEKKKEGEGGVFSIVVSDLCKGCGACVEVCGDDAIAMVDETPALHADMLTQAKFLDLLPETPKKFLGTLDADNIKESRAAALRYHLMLRSKYASLISGDGACAGCGEKSVLRAAATINEALMRPIYHRKAERVETKAKQLAERGLTLLASAKAADAKSYETFVKTVLQAVMGKGGTDDADTDARIKAEWKGGDKEIVDALVAVLRQTAYNHRDVRTIEGKTPDGMCAMAMTAHTGCNSVFGSTPPNNPHPYPWMNSLFQDGATIGWIIGESFIQNHARHSVVPERLADALLQGLSGGFGDKDRFRFTHFTDAYMSDDEVLELPKVWAIGGDGGMGDIGFQNLSKVILQNRPNVKVMMLNTQVYSNTGGQNSESSVMPGGFDMNQIGPAQEGKLTEMKSVAECFLGGHGSAFIAQVSLANSANLYKTLIDGLCYRGTAYFQVYTACMPEHGIGDDVAQRQASMARDSRCVPEFVFDPSLGESYADCLNLKGNTDRTRDWMKKRIPGGSKETYDFTIAHWAVTEARFRPHHKPVPADKIAGLVKLEDILGKMRMDDIIHRRFLDPTSSAFIPEWGVYITDYDAAGKPKHHVLSRHMVIFCVERRRAWRMLQSRAGLVNEDYKAAREAATAAAKPATAG